MSEALGFLPGVKTWGPVIHNRRLFLERSIRDPTSWPCLRSQTSCSTSHRRCPRDHTSWACSRSRSVHALSSRPLGTSSRTLPGSPTERIYLSRIESDSKSPDRFSYIFTTFFDPRFIWNTYNKRKFCPGQICNENQRFFARKCKKHSKTKRKSCLNPFETRIISAKCIPNPENHGKQAIISAKRA